MASIINSQPGRGEPPQARRETVPETYQCGTLHYSSRGVAHLFFWLLGGDFAFMFFESIFGRFMPLYLRDLHASNTLIGVITGSFAGLVNILFLPNISQWSDRHRGRFGRRIPFLVVVAPLTVLSLVCVGFAPELAAWMHARWIVPLFPGMSSQTATLALLCALVVSFHFFNMVLVNAYNWLLRDVVPEELMARFLSWFRIVGMLGSFAFLWFVFPHMGDLRKTIFPAVGGAYLLVFMLMCWQIREGGYPSPRPKKEGPGIFRSFALYFRECLGISLYRNFFIASVLVVLALSCAAPFTTLFMRETLGLNMDDVGKVFAWGAAASTLAYYPAGRLCEKFGALNVAKFSTLVLAVVSLAANLFITDVSTLIVYTVIIALPTVGWGLGAFAGSMSLFPKESFGQFSSGLNVFGCGALIVGNYMMGNLMDLVGSNYRMAFLWSAGFFATAAIPMWFVYGDWKCRGGSDGYVPPLPDA